MAVELASPDGVVTCFTWGTVLREFSIELRRGALTGFEGSDLLAVEVTGNDGWRGLVPGRVRSASLVWGVSAATDRAPIAVRMLLDHNAVRITTGERNEKGGWWFGMDEVAVMFGDHVAVEAGLPFGSGTGA